MGFEQALAALREHLTVARTAWKGQSWLRIIEPEPYLDGDDDLIEPGPQFRLFHHDGSVEEWLDVDPEQLTEDMIAEDWVITADKKCRAKEQTNVTVRTMIRQDSPMCAKKIVEDNFNMATLEDRAALLQRISDDPYRFFPVAPSESGMARTVWLSQDPQLPVFVVSADEGRDMSLTNRCQIFGQDESTPFPDVNSWLEKHRALLLLLIHAQIDAADFYDIIKGRPTHRQPEADEDLVPDKESDTYKMLDHAVKHRTMVSSKGMSKEEFFRALSGDDV